ncbi:MAG: UMP kinase [Rickettsia sp.]|nr:UMP kinase [Rickettsia sp.]
MLKNRRIALKISGESFSSLTHSLQDIEFIDQISLGIKKIYDAKINIILIVGGGNVCRGIEGKGFMNRVTTDQIGMLGTLINALTLKNSLDRLNVDSKIQSAIQVNYICEPFVYKRALKHLSENKIVIFASGTGHPFFSTDTAAVLRALEMNCEILLKATNVQGVFSEDPKKNSKAEFYSKISYDELINKNLKVMDMTAISMAKENRLPIKVFSIQEHRNFLDILNDQGNYSLIH